MEITLKKGDISVTVRQDKDEYYHYRDIQELARLLFDDLTLGLPMVGIHDKKKKE